MTSYDYQVYRSLSRLVGGEAAQNEESFAGSKTPLAAFDADGTLWDGDCAEEFMRWMKASNRWSQHGDFVGRWVSRAICSRSPCCFDIIGV